MPSLYLAAVDLGATSGRVILGRWARQRLTLQEVYRFPSTILSMGGHDYWELASLWDQVRTGLGKAAAALPRGATLASVGVDTWGCDHVLLDDDGRLVFPVHAYRDGRTQTGLNRLLRTRAAYARIYAATGIPSVFYNTSFQLEETVNACPAVTDLATRCLFLPDYFNFLLSGRMAVEISTASTSQLLDVHSRHWSRAALAYFKIPTTWFTPPILAGTKLGRVRDIPALAGTQVIAVPGHDTACAYDAMPADPAGGDLYLSSGTWSVLGFENDQPILGPEALAAQVANERTGSGRYRPLTGVVGLWLLEGTLKAFATRPQNDGEWATLITIAEKLPAPVGLLHATDPVFTNPPSMKAAIDGHLKKRGLTPPKNLAGYVRLICESLGQAHADALHAFVRLADRKFHRILMVGGGARNRLLCQTTANASGLPVVSFDLEGSAVGNLANQLIALKAVKDLATFRRLLGRTLKQTVYQPRSSS